MKKLMSQWFGQGSGRRGRPSSRALRARRPRRYLPGLDALEGRMVLSLVSHEFGVNSTIRNAQFESDNASSSNGMSVVVWTDTYSNSDHDIRAQLFDANGEKGGRRSSSTTPRSTRGSRRWPWTAAGISW
jgi:hypothetical protein